MREDSKAPFTDHLEELRKRLIRSVIAVVIGFILTYAFKDKLFEILDTLEQGTRPIMVKAREELETRFGKDALEPWNTGYFISVSIFVCCRCFAFDSEPSFWANICKMCATLTSSPY